MEQATNLKTDFCPDCGPVGVSHWIERWSARVDPIGDFLTKPFQWIWIFIRPAVELLNIESLLPFFYKAFAALGLGKIITAPDEENNWRARVLWEEAMRRGITMWEFRPFGLVREFFWSSYNGDVRVFDGLPRPHGSSEKSLAWMDDKGIILKKFAAEGIPVPRGGSCRTFAQAEAVLHKIDDSVIVKPHLGSRSRHTYTNITKIDALRHAFLKAKELSPSPVVEEELSGFVFRITLIGGAIGGIMRREPPHVIGDNKHTVRELVSTENLNPLRRGPIFHEIALDDTAEATLKAQGLSLNSIPAAGLMVSLNPKVSRTFGASTTEFANEEAHPENRELFLHIGRVLDDPIVGIDFMINDIGRSWRDQKKCGVIECNSLPFIDLHHFPLKGTPRNVAGAVWDLIY